MSNTLVTWRGARLNLQGMATLSSARRATDSSIETVVAGHDGALGTASLYRAPTLRSV